MRKAAHCAMAMLWLAACSPAPPPPHLAPGDVPAAFAQPQAAPLWPAADWWRGFRSGALSRLIAEAQARNTDLAGAAARLEQADAQAREAGAALLPSLGLDAGLQNYYGRANGTSLRETDWGAALGASYELDFWGKNRDAREAALARRTASAADRATVALGVTAAVADGYFRLLALRERIAIAKDNLRTAGDILALVQRRVSAGYAAPADLAQQRIALAAAAAEVPVLEQQELETRDALAILVGRPPEGFSVPDADIAALAQPAVTPGLPSMLLTRRPDIAAAEANLRAAHADLAAARVAFLPDISLTAAAGAAYPALAAAIDTLPGAGLGTEAGASLVQAIFDGGRLQARTDEARARESELLAAYRGAVIAAFSDVENAEGNLSHLAAQQDALGEQVRQSRNWLAAARRQYAAGSADFLAVADAEQKLAAAQDQLCDIRAARLIASVALFKALGGGWRADANNG